MRVTRSIRVRPGASVTAVGGALGEGDDAVLVVRVNSPAVDGRATQAALSALAQALGLRPRQVGLVRGATSRTKVVWVEPGDDQQAARIVALWDDLMTGQSSG